MSKGIDFQPHQVLLRPLVTEKGVHRSTRNNQYTFEINPLATKEDVKVAVEAMFDRISPVYDTMNRLMTAGLDGRWRRLTARAVVRPGDRVLDACCGTGSLALEAQRAGHRICLGRCYARNKT